MPAWSLGPAVDIHPSNSCGKTERVPEREGTRVYRVNLDILHASQTRQYIRLSHLFRYFFDQPSTRTIQTSGLTTLWKFCPNWSGMSAAGGGRQRRRHLINYSKLLGENTDSDSEGGRERAKESKEGKEGGVFLRSRERLRVHVQMTSSNFPGFYTPSLPLVSTEFTQPPSIWSEFS